jgi:hypothetical protein
MPIHGFSAYEQRHQKVIPRRRFAARMVTAVGLWIVLTFFGLCIGMAGYSTFEGMSFTDAYVNAAMILSGMGPIGELKTKAGKDLCWLLCDLLGPHNRGCHGLRPGADLSSGPASISHGDR